MGVDAIAGYAGRRLAVKAPGAAKAFAQTRLNINLPFATDDKYRKACPRYKTNSKNLSAFTLGDNRDISWQTTNNAAYVKPDGFEDSGHQESLVPVDWRSM